MNEIISFDVYVDEEEMTGVDKISLVKKPAILTDFVYMADQVAEEYKQIILSEDDKQIITGPALIPDLEIIRKDDDGEPYYIKYSKDQIEKIAQKFFKLKDNYSVNKDHKNNQAEDTFIFESWIVGENDKSKDLGFDVPQGTWMVSMKVDNPELWQQIKSGKYKGFSIEGLFKFKRSSRLVKQERFFRRNLRSSNVNSILYDDVTKEMVIKFQEGDIYTYFNIEPNTFRSVVTGTGGVCKTEGSNQFGSWEVGKTPSIGAAVWEQLRDRNVKYQKGGDLTLAEEEEEENKIEQIEKEKMSSNYNIGMAEVALVKPGASESQEEFISRCMGDEKMNSEFPEQEQRAAVCYAYWDEKQEKININMVSANLKDGRTLNTDAESMAVGVEVYFMENDQKQAVDSGEYELEDGTIITVEDSKIKEIKDVELGGDYKKEDEEMMRDGKKEEKMEIDPMLMEQFDALKGMLENLNLKIDALMGEEEMGKVKQSVDALEVKFEKVIAEKELKSVETVDSLKKVAQSEVGKKRADYDLIKKYNTKF
jgi:hypothetical protein